MMGCFFGCFRFNPLDLIDDVVVCPNPPSSDGLRLVPPEQIMSRNQHQMTSSISPSNDCCNSGEDGIDKAEIPSETLKTTPELNSPSHRETDYSPSIKTRRCVDASVKNNNVVAQAYDDDIFTPKKICYEKQQPFPTPLGLTDEMQTPATVYPSSHGSIRSQYVYPVAADIVVDDDALCGVGNSEKESDRKNSGDDVENNNTDINMPMIAIRSGIPNSTTKYKEDQKVCWHATPFVERLEKELVRNLKASAAVQFGKEG